MIANDAFYQTYQYLSKHASEKIEILLSLWIYNESCVIVFECACVCVCESICFKSLISILLLRNSFTFRATFIFSENQRRLEKNWPSNFSCVTPLQYYYPFSSEQSVVF